MTQEQFAEKLGVSNRSVSRWENGKTMPDYSLFPSICETLRVSVSELLEGKYTEKNDSLKNKIHLIIELLDYERQKKQKIINHCLIICSICLLLKILQNQLYQIL
jgi:transcriptional regulator with XRE-family HTH domain